MEKGRTRSRTDAFAGVVDSNMDLRLDRLSTDELAFLDMAIGVGRSLTVVSFEIDWLDERVARRAGGERIATHNLFCFCLAMSIHEGDGLTSSEATTLLLVER